MYDLRITVDEVKGFCDLPMKPGHYFEVKGGKIIVPDNGYICLWALQSMMPILPLKQREINEENDWTPHTSRFSCPDPNGRVIFKIERVDPVSGKVVDIDPALKASPPPRIIVDEELCTGCRACETICSFTHTGSFNGEKSRIKIEKNEEAGLDIPHVCRQCGDAPCVKICPTGALERDPITKAVLVEAEKCIGCQKCATACSFGAINFIDHSTEPIICDLCQGRIECVQRCPVGAIKFTNPENILE